MHNLCVAFNHVVVILSIKAVSILQFKPGIEEDDLSVSARESEASGSRMETETDEERDVERKEAGAAEEETEMLLSMWIYEVVKSQISQLSCSISLRHAPFWS